MHLRQILHEVPLWLLTLIVVAIAEIYSIGLLLLARRYYGVERLATNNEVAGFKFAVVGLFYGVMLAFVVIAVWEDLHRTQNAVRAEAKAALDLQRLTLAMPADDGAEIRKLLTAYVQDVKTDEWPAMALGKSSDKVSEDLLGLSLAIFKMEAGERKELALYQHALRLLTVITDSRNERLDASEGAVPKFLWFVLIAGGAITLGYPAFFGASHLQAQILMTASLAALVSLSLALALAFDYPFTGGEHVSVVPFDQALQQMSGPEPAQ
ncbi:MAG TPA: hypothetical protein VIG52_11125 [Methyloceanibacter sp.]|jgi:hypothetical protein